MVSTVTEPTGEPIPGLLPGLRYAYDGAPQRVCVALGEELRIVYANPAVLRHASFAGAGGLIGRTMVEAFPAANHRHLLRVLRSGRPFQRAAAPFAGPDGVVRYWDVTVHPLRIEDGRTGLVLSASEVTGRRNDPGATAAELSGILDGIADAVVLLRSGRCARVNAAALRLGGEPDGGRLLGRTARELSERYRFEPLDGDGPFRLGAVWRDRGLRARLVRPDGSEAIVSVAVSRLEDASLVCLLRDITAEHETRRALDEALADSRRQAERLAAIIESIPVGVRLWDREGRLRLQNRQAQEIAGDRILPQLEEGDLGEPRPPLPVLAEGMPAARALRG